MKAVVLRVDSGGGSAFASEMIRRECELTRGAGKPVVVSMGSVAASGGYWISTASDEIWASPDTITGSIGIFGMFPTIDKPLAKYLGVHTDGVGTTRFADALRPDRPTGPRRWPTSSSSRSTTATRSSSRASSKARKMSQEQVDQIARGRVWSGEDAKGLGLVDQLGGLDQAIESAAKRAKLAKGYRVWYVEKDKTFRERVAGMLAASVLAARARGRLDAGRLVALRARDVRRGAAARDAVGAGALSRWNDPRGVYAHCLCGDD